MTDDDQSRNPLEQARDLLVLPVGFVLELPATVPRILARGKQVLHRNGAALPGDVLEQLQVHAHRTLRALGIGTTAQECRGPLPDDIDADVDAPLQHDVPPNGDAPPTNHDNGGPPPTVGRIVAGATVVGGIATRVDKAPLTPPPHIQAAAAPDHSAEGSPGFPVEGPDPDGLAIPGYDSLSASQVVPRLESLSGDELELVRQYEQANRGRKTILSKIAQLQS